MKKIYVLGLAVSVMAISNTAFSQNLQEAPLKLAKATKSSTQRVAAGQIRRNHDFSNLAQDYTDFKNEIGKKYNFEYGIDISYMPQRATPGGRKTSYQTLIYPYFNWTTFNNEYGTGSLNFAYNITRYGGVSGNHLGSNVGAVTGINDYTSTGNSFDELYYTYQLGGSWNWLTFALGQFPLYNFDGSAYDSNQQENFINYALSQNASSTYPTASLGSYIQVAPNNDWNLAFGMQDATNISGESIKFNHLNQKHYTSFASLSYTPTFSRLGGAQYSILLYNQPSVKLQQGTTNGWSLNFSQDLGKKLSIFARINGVSGDVAEINQSWVLGTVYNNPFNRNPLDQLGLAFAYNKIDEKAAGSPLIHNSEKILETYFAFGISKWMTLTPDVQIYFDPATNQKSNTAAVFSLRATLMF